MDKLISQRIMKPWLMGTATSNYKSLGMTLTMELRDMGVEDNSSLPELKVCLVEGKDGRRSIVITKLDEP